MALCQVPGPRQTVGPCTPTCLRASGTPHSAVHIHFDMPPNASVNIIKRGRLLGKTFRQIYLGTDLITRPLHWFFQQPAGLFADCVRVERGTLGADQIIQSCLEIDRETFYTRLPIFLVAVVVIANSVHPSLCCPHVSVPALFFFFSHLFPPSLRRSPVHRNETEPFEPKGHGRRRSSAYSDLALPEQATPSSLACQLMACKRLSKLS